jgi:hypothetical protein
VAEGKDPQLGRRLQSPFQNSTAQCDQVLRSCVNDCGAYVQIKKVERKPRKVKAVPPEKRAAKFKMLAEFAELKLKANQPQALWTKQKPGCMTAKNASSSTLWQTATHRHSL